MSPLNRRIVVSTLTLVALASLSLGLGAQPASPLNGTWMVNVAKSTFSPVSLAPKSSTSKVDITGDMIKVVVDGVDSMGLKVHTEYAVKMDGKDYPWKGTVDGKPSVNQDTVAWTRIDDYTYESTNKLKGQVLTTQRVVIAKDGKTRTNTVTGKNAEGQTVNHTVLYEKH
jgi:hypothetical protein